MRSEETAICCPVFSCPGWRRSIRPGMMAQTRKERFNQTRLGKPGVEIIAEHVFVEQSGEVEPPVPHHLAHVGKSPYAERIFIGDEASGPARARSTRRVSSIPRLWCKPPLEWITNEIMPFPAREGLDQDLGGAARQTPRSGCATSPTLDRGAASNGVDRRAGAAHGPRDRLRAETCHHHRREFSAPWHAIA
jgi:hypothetical protein